MGIGNAFVNKYTLNAQLGDPQIFSWLSGFKYYSRDLFWGNYIPAIHLYDGKSREHKYNFQPQIANEYDHPALYQIILI